jgi:hypothetical protein
MQLTIPAKTATSRSEPAEPYRAAVPLSRSEEGRGGPFAVHRYACPASPLAPQGAPRLNGRPPSVAASCTTAPLAPQGEGLGVRLLLILTLCQLCVLRVSRSEPSEPFRRGLRVNVPQGGPVSRNLPMLT